MKQTTMFAVQGYAHLHMAHFFLRLWKLRVWWSYNIYCVEKATLELNKNDQGRWIHCRLGWYIVNLCWFHGHNGPYG